MQGNGWTPIATGRGPQYDAGPEDSPGRRMYATVVRPSYLLLVRGTRKLYVA